jgi:5-methylcytosine-specific restriction protein A
METLNIEKLSRWLNSTGKAAFVEYFDILRENCNKMNRHKLGELLSDHNSPASRPRIKTASYAISIFRKGWEWEALRICYDSQKLNGNIREQARLLLNKHNRYFEKQVSLSISAGNDIRKKRLEKSLKIPDRIQIHSSGYKRNPDVVAEVLIRADGKCESCGKAAPFVRESGEMKGIPFLEVHHKIWLSENGEDSVENAVALCPNCHRQEHFGKRKFEHKC